MRELLLGVIGTAFLCLVFFIGALLTLYMNDQMAWIVAVIGGAGVFLPVALFVVAKIKPIDSVKASIPTEKIEDSKMQNVSNFSLSDIYVFVGAPTGILAFLITFFGAWIYCIATYGFLLGVGLGWLPSLIVAIIAGAIACWLWPLIALAIAIIVLLILFN